MLNELDNKLFEICAKDHRYQIDAYHFVLEALSFTQRKFKRTKHVTGKELLEGIKVLLMEKFGPLTMTVLKHWGISSTQDLGNIVFHLVEQKILSKSEEDNIQNFQNVFDFELVFEKGYKRSLAKKISRLK